MADVTKAQLEQLADDTEELANEALDKAIRFGVEHGAQAGLGDLVSAGALFTAAAELRRRAKDA